jgi:hypothetical protein
MWGAQVPIFFALFLAAIIEIAVIIYLYLRYRKIRAHLMGATVLSFGFVFLMAFFGQPVSLPGVFLVLISSTWIAGLFTLIFGPLSYWLFSRLLVKRTS